MEQGENTGCPNPLLSQSFIVHSGTNPQPFLGLHRQTGLGMGSTMARVGSIVSPLVSMTSELYPSLPLFIYGTVPVVASIFTALLPETLGQPLPDTVQELENRWANSFPPGSKDSPQIQTGVSAIFSKPPSRPSSLFIHPPQHLRSEVFLRLQKAIDICGKEIGSWCG